MAVLKTTSPWPSTPAPRARPRKERPSSRTRAAGGAPGSALKYHRRVEPFDLLQADLDPLALRGGHVLAHVGRADRELPVPTVDQHRELYGARAPELDQGLHRGAGGAAVVDHVVDQDDGPLGDVRHPGGRAPGRGGPPVVPMSG